MFQVGFLPDFNDQKHGHFAKVTYAAEATLSLLSDAAMQQTLSDNRDDKRKGLTGVEEKLLSQALAVSDLAYEIDKRWRSGDPARMDEAKGLMEAHRHSAQEMMVSLNELPLSRNAKDANVLSLQGVVDRVDALALYKGVNDHLQERGSKLAIDVQTAEKILEGAREGRSLKLQTPTGELNLSAKDLRGFVGEADRDMQAGGRAAQQPANQERFTQDARAR